jgi:hypothetical protein
MGTAGGEISSVVPGAIEVHVSEPGVDVISSDAGCKEVAVKMAVVGESEMDATVERHANSKTTPAENALIAK